jgi:hypothetical protein
MTLNDETRQCRTTFKKITRLQSRELALEDIKVITSYKYYFVKNMIHINTKQILNKKTFKSYNIII